MNTSIKNFASGAAATAVVALGLGVAAVPTDAFAARGGGSGTGECGSCGTPSTPSTPAGESSDRAAVVPACDLRSGSTHYRLFFKSKNGKIFKLVAEFNKKEYYGSYAQIMSEFNEKRPHSPETSRDCLGKANDALAQFLVVGRTTGKLAPAVRARANVASVAVAPKAPNPTPKNAAAEQPQPAPKEDDATVSCKPVFNREDKTIQFLRCPIITFAVAGDHTLETIGEAPSKDLTPLMVCVGDTAFLPVLNPKP